MKLISDRNIKSRLAAMAKNPQNTRKRNREWMPIGSNFAGPPEKEGHFFSSRNAPPGTVTSAATWDDYFFPHS
jgi:hypothetical protein